MPARNRPTTPLRNPRANTTLRTVSVVDSRGRHERATQRSLYAAHLRSTTSKNGDRYSRHTIDSYLAAVDGLDDWATGQGRTGGFDTLTTADLNEYFGAYRDGHTQGGTNTRQRRLGTFYKWVVAELDPGAVSPMDAAARYATSEPAPLAYGPRFLDELLADCRGRDFEDIRDAAILRLLGTGVRRGELAKLWVQDIDLAERLVTVPALKGTRRNAAVLRRDMGEEMRVGRVVPFGDATAIALGRWLRMRAAHKLVKTPDSGPLWYSTRGRGRLQGNGIWRMVKRRAEASGFDPAMVTVHGFRHTRADQLMDNEDVSDGDVMTLMGWSDRAMLDRYAANLKHKRAIKAVRRAGLVD